MDAEQDFCARCEKNVPQNLFATHLEAVHSNDKDILGLIDETVSKIGTERKENWIKNAREFQCDECGEEFENQFDSNNHKQIHKYYPANSMEKICCKKSVPKRLLQRHVEYVHQNSQKTPFNIIKEGTLLSLSESDFINSKR